MPIVMNCDSLTIVNNITGIKFHLLKSMYPRNFFGLF